MSSDIVRFTSDAGTEVTITPDDVRRYVCEAATDKEVGLFLAHCRAHNLDPIGSKDAYLVKYGDKPASIITGYQVFNRRARKCPDYAGIRSGVVTIAPTGEVRHKQGSAVYPEADGKLVGGWAEVHVKGWEAPAYCEVSLADYSTGKSNWAKMPGVMIEKVAKAAAWRLAYPDEFGGMYTSEEMDQATHGGARAAQAAAQAAVAARVEPAAPDDGPEPDYEEPGAARAPMDAVRDLVRDFAAAAGFQHLSDAALGLAGRYGRSAIGELDDAQLAETAAYMRRVIGEATAA